jgi:hypothetical protein
LENIMKTSFTKQQITLTVACALVMGLASGVARAQNFGPADQRELWTDTPKAQVWKNGYGECWHSAFGPPPSASECNPAPIAQYVAPAPAPAPVVTRQPAPAPAPVIEPAPLAPRKTRG